MVTGQNWKGGGREVFFICCEKESAGY